MCTVTKINKCYETWGHLSACLLPSYPPLSGCSAGLFYSYLFLELWVGLARCIRSSRAWLPSTVIPQLYKAGKSELLPHTKSSFWKVRSDYSEVDSCLQAAVWKRNVSLVLSWWKCLWLFHCIPIYVSVDSTI